MTSGGVDTSSGDEAARVAPALRWIVAELERHGVPYQAVGGVAVRAYGGARPVVDIDLYIPYDVAGPLLDAVRPYLVREPAPYRSASWDLTYLKLDHHGQPIELGDTSSRQRIYNQLAGRWEDQAIDFAASTPVTLFGVDFLAMPLADLVAYKAGLDRPVDRIDVADLRALDSPRVAPA